MATVKPHPEFPAVIDNSDIGHGDFEKNACIIFCSVVPVFIILRFYSRIVAKQLGVDDWASLAAFVSKYTDTLIIILDVNEYPLDICHDVQWCHAGW